MNAMERTGDVCKRLPRLGIFLDTISNQHTKGLMPDLVYQWRVVSACFSAIGVDGIRLSEIVTNLGNQHDVDVKEAADEIDGLLSGLSDKWREVAELLSDASEADMSFYEIESQATDSAEAHGVTYEQALGIILEVTQ